VQTNSTSAPQLLSLCAENDEISMPQASTELIRCRDAYGNFVTKGTKLNPPDKLSSSVSMLIPTTGLTALETIRGSFTLYITDRVSGRKDVFFGASRYEVMPNITIESLKKKALAMREADDESMITADYTGWDDSFVAVSMSISRIATALAQAINDVTMSVDDDFSGTAKIYAGDFGIAASESAAGPAKGNPVIYSAAAWAAAAAQPFAAGMDIRASITFMLSGTRRYLVAMEPPAGAQGMVGISDDAGASWTTVNIGGAAAGHGATGGGALFAYDEANIWLVSAAGYIYKSIDGGATWTAQESGTITAGAYNAVHFYDENYGIAVAAAGITAVTRDGGTHWSAGAIPAASAGNTVWMTAQDTAFIGLANGQLFRTNNLATAWTRITGWVGDGVGAVKDVMFVNQHCGFMVSNTAAPVGTILRTLDQGNTWEVITTPTNSGLNSVWAIDPNHLWAVGAVNAATAVILYGQPA
jgi:photosystem II stability/assembly factor-like uncharacterized protein